MKGTSETYSWTKQDNKIFRLYYWSERMKKAIVLTLNDNKFNYGNRLQNLASIFILTKLGLEPYSLSLYKKESRVIFFLKYLVCLKKAKKKIYKKKINFLTFEKKRLHKIGLNSEIIKQAELIYVGSDQVWNSSYWNKGDENFYTLKFIDRQRKIALAPSFGCDVIDNSFNEVFATELVKFSKLSCREKVGCSYIKQITGFDCKLLIDPTLALTKNEWFMFLEPIKFKKKYLLVYCLGDIDFAMNQDIKAISNLYNLEIHIINNRKDPFYSFNPSQFLSAILNANIIITDSYHCSIFSFIFDKPFIVYRRKGKSNEMYNRIHDFLQEFNLMRKSRDYIDIYDKKLLFEHEYNESKIALAQRQNDFYSYLDDF